MSTLTTEELDQLIANEESQRETARLARIAREDEDERMRGVIDRAAKDLGIKVDHVAASGTVRFHDERGSRPFSTPLGRASTYEDVHAALEVDVKRMRGLRLMEILREGWTIDRIDQGQREMLQQAMFRLSEHVDGAIAVAVDALIADPSKARAILQDEPYKHIALAVAKERRKEIAAAEREARAKPQEPDEP